MGDRLVVCPECRRHASARESACPFCGVPFDPSRPLDARRRGATLAAAIVSIAASACETAPHPVPANPPAIDVQPPAATPDAAAAAQAPDAGQRGSGEPAAVYGGPPPR